MDILVYHRPKNRTYKIHSEITGLVTVITATLITPSPMSEGYLLAMDPDAGALVAVAF